MYRGTTPTLNFQLPLVVSQITKLNIAFSQNDVVVLEKSLQDVTCSGRTITLKLSEAETLSLNDKKELKIQLRIGIGNNRLASGIITTNVKSILKEGVL